MHETKPKELEDLITSLKRHEGYRPYVYKDSEGNLTCGWGHHLSLGSHVPIEAAEAFFRADVSTAIRSFFKLPKKYRKALDTRARRMVITEMIFNMGLAKVLGFKKMWTAVENGDYETAADEMLDSKWHQQVGKRADTLAGLLRNSNNNDVRGV